jgi:hypothetical protein
MKVITKIFLFLFTVVLCSKANCRVLSMITHGKKMGMKFHFEF